MYYQSLDPNEDYEAVKLLCQKHNMRVQKYLLDTKYGRNAQYYKLVKGRA